MPLAKMSLKTIFRSSTVVDGSASLPVSVIYLNQSKPVFKVPVTKMQTTRRQTASIVVSTGTVESFSSSTTTTKIKSFSHSRTSGEKMLEGWSFPSLAMSDSPENWVPGNQAVFLTPRSPSPKMRVTRRSSIYVTKSKASKSSGAGKEFKAPLPAKIKANPSPVGTRTRRSSIYKKGSVDLIGVTSFQVAQEFKTKSSKGKQSPNTTHQQPKLPISFKGSRKRNMLDVEMENSVEQPVAKRWKGQLEAESKSPSPAGLKKKRPTSTQKRVLSKVQASTGKSGHGAASNKLKKRSQTVISESTVKSPAAAKTHTSAKSKSTSAKKSMKVKSREKSKKGLEEEQQNSTSVDQTPGTGKTNTRKRKLPSDSPKSAKATPQLATNESKSVKKSARKMQSKAARVSSSSASKSATKSAMKTKSIKETAKATRKSARRQISLGEAEDTFDGRIFQLSSHEQLHATQKQARTPSQAVSPAKTARQLQKSTVKSPTPAKKSPKSPKKSPVSTKKSAKSEVPESARTSAKSTRSTNDEGTVETPVSKQGKPSEKSTKTQKRESATFLKSQKSASKSGSATKSATRTKNLQLSESWILEQSDEANLPMATPRRKSLGLTASSIKQSANVSRSEKKSSSTKISTAGEKPMPTFKRSTPLPTGTSSAEKLTAIQRSSASVKRLSLSPKSTPRPVAVITSTPKSTGKRASLRKSLLISLQKSANLSRNIGNDSFSTKCQNTDLVESGLIGESAIARRVHGGEIVSPGSRALQSTSVGLHRSTRYVESREEFGEWADEKTDTSALSSSDSGNLTYASSTYSSRCAIL